jgi:hypothetical protein
MEEEPRAQRNAEERRRTRLLRPRDVRLRVGLHRDAAAEHALVTHADHVKAEIGEDDVLVRAIVGARVDGGGERDGYCSGSNYSEQKS